MKQRFAQGTRDDRESQNKDVENPMKYAHDLYAAHSEEISHIADLFGLNREGLVVEAYIPKQTAIFVETVDDKKFRLHVNLEENRIISVKQLGVDKAEVAEFDKYMAFMK